MGEEWEKKRNTLHTTHGFMWPTYNQLLSSLCIDEDTVFKQKNLGRIVCVLKCVARFLVGTLSSLGKYTVTEIRDSMVCMCVYNYISGWDWGHAPIR